MVTIMDSVKENSSNSSSGNTVKYPLRSAVKPKVDKSSVLDDTASSNLKRRTPASSVSKSVSVLDVSGKDKSAKPPRRLSVPSKSSISPHCGSSGTKTPISEARTKNANKGQRSNEKPVSDVAKQVCRKKFSVLSSCSYWLSQIKLSEAAAKHSISLGFFKLALESGCEAFQRMRDELKSYVHRHNLVELGEPLKELLTSYNISDDMDQLQVSESCSPVPGEATQSSEECVRSSCSVDDDKKLQPNSLGSVDIQASFDAESAKKERSPEISENNNIGEATPSSEECVPRSSIDADKKLKPKSLSSENVRASLVAESAKKGKTSANKSRTPIKKDSTKSETVSNKQQKKCHRPVKQVPKKETTKNRNQGENNVGEKDRVESLPAGETEQDGKENKDTHQLKDICLTEVVA